MGNLSIKTESTNLVKTPKSDSTLLVVSGRYACWSNHGPIERRDAVITVRALIAALESEAADH